MTKIIATPKQVISILTKNLNSLKCSDSLEDFTAKFSNLQKFTLTTMRSKQEHFTAPLENILEDNFFKTGKMLDGSSISDWKGVEASDMVLTPSEEEYTEAPFKEDSTLIIVCDIIEPSTMQGYHLDPRHPR